MQRLETKSSTSTIIVGDYAVGYREAGTGERLAVLVHASGSSPSQWRSLMRGIAEIGGDVRLLAPALGGYGTSRVDGGPPDAVDDATILAGFIEAKAPGERVEIIGHSYGGLTALIVALNRPDMVKSLTLFEPVIVNLLRDAGEVEAYDEISRTGDDYERHMAAADEISAAKVFVAYWTGRQAWQMLEPHQHADIIACMPKVAKEWSYISRWNPDIAALSDARFPIRLIRGERTTLASSRTIAVLRARLPQAEYNVIPGVGHMAPVTHPERVNPLLQTFLRVGAC